MAQMIYPEDLVFPVDGSGAYDPSSRSISSQIPMDVDFQSRPRATPPDFANYSVIANLTGNGSPVGTLALRVTNASFDVSGSGFVTFKGPVDWMTLSQSIVPVGGTSNGQPVTPPFDMGVDRNRWGAFQLIYTATSGSGTLYAKFRRVGG